jgi:transcriptional regulator NrdR family protein
MFCPKCGEQAKTIDSRRSPGKVRRRRRCFHCEYRFTTLELIRPSSNFSDVIRKRAEEFFFKGKKVSALEKMALKELSAFGCLLVDEYLKGKLQTN